MRLFPKIDGVLNETDGILWLPFTKAEIPGGSLLPDTYVFELFVQRAEEMSLER